jgi:hypothetical protein
MSQQPNLSAVELTQKAYSDLEAIERFELYTKGTTHPLYVQFLKDSVHSTIASLGSVIKLRRYTVINLKCLVCRGKDV